jgi:serine protease AprX
MVGINQPAKLNSNSFAIMQSPNPFTTTTTISYTLEITSFVTISIFNTQGKLIDMIEQKQREGKHKVQWNAEGLPAGMYYCRILVGDKVELVKMIKY